MLAALVLLAPPALAIEVEAPTSVRPGEAFHAVARLTNRSKDPVVIVRPEVFGYELGLSFGGGLFAADGKLLPTTPGGIRAVQWMLPYRYGPDRFQTLAPGEGAVVEDITFRQVYTQPFSGLKRDLSTTPTADLAPGEYTLRYTYGFTPSFHINRNRRGGPKPELTPEGRTLYRKAWTGKVEGTAKVVVAAE